MKVVSSQRLNTGKAEADFVSGQGKKSLHSLSYGTIF